MDYVKIPINTLGNIAHKITPYFRGSPQAEKIIVEEIHSMLPLKGKIFVKIAGVSGCSAILLSAYGAHGFNSKQGKGDDKKPNLKEVFNTGARYHLLHSAALLAVPLSSQPYITGSLMLVGGTMFCGSCYAYALTENETLRKFAPYGGMILAAAWLSFIF